MQLFEKFNYSKLNRITPIYREATLTHKYAPSVQVRNNPYIQGSNRGINAKPVSFIE